MSNIFFLFTLLISSLFSTTPNLGELDIQEKQEIAEQIVPQDIKEDFLKVSRVVDGDTIELETGEKVRYIGIDTPETKDPNRDVECYGKEASNKNKELVEGKEVRLEKDVSETDRYGRLLRYIYIDDVFINDFLVREGYAKASSYPPDIKHQEQFKESEKYARENNKGLWGEICEIKSVPVKTIKPTPLPTVKPTPFPTKQPVQVKKIIPTAEPIAPKINYGYSCSCSKTCSQMSSCDEAYYQLNNCGCGKRDGDSDGVPCESICPGG